MANKKGEAMLIELSGQMLERFKVLQKHYGETESTEVVRRLICETYDKMQAPHGKKILIGSHVYETLETMAKGQGLSVDEYVDKIISDRTELSAYAEGYKHGKADAQA